MRYPTSNEAFIPQATGPVLTFTADGEVYVLHEDGTREDVPREQAEALLGFSPADQVTKPVRRYEYAQMVVPPNGRKVGDTPGAGV